MEDFMMGAGIILGFILIITLFILGLSPIRINTTAAGQHTGYITAVEQSGLFYKNYVVYFKTDNSSSQEDKYCLPEENTQLARALREYNKKRKLVELSYKGVSGYSWALCGNDMIIGVEPVQQ
jgi:hypothetical protein